MRLRTCSTSRRHEVSRHRVNEADQRGIGGTVRTGFTVEHRALEDSNFRKCLASTFTTVTPLTSDYFAVGYRADAGVIVQRTGKKTTFVEILDEGGSTREIAEDLCSKMRYAFKWKRARLKTITVRSSATSEPILWGYAGLGEQLDADRLATMIAGIAIPVGAVVIGLALNEWAITLFGYTNVVALVTGIVLLIAALVRRWQWRPAWK